MYYYYYKCVTNMCIILLLFVAVITTARLLGAYLRQPRKQRDYNTAYIGARCFSEALPMTSVSRSCYKVESA